MTWTCLIDSGSINAYGPMASSSHGLPGLGLGGQGQTSPAHSPNNCPPGAIDIELEIGDHEVDTMFRDPGPKPIIVARSTPPLQVHITNDIFAQSICTHYFCFENMGRFATLKKTRSKIWGAKSRVQKTGSLLFKKRRSQAASSLFK